MGRSLGSGKERAMQRKQARTTLRKKTGTRTGRTAVKGRPDPVEKRKVPFALRMSRYDKDRLKVLADHMGLTVSVNST
ncbi:hypothetical protein DAERI_010056 [Deinococcus aerius]|uniref:Uncharacterized protein n=1 Tax=Deinococcus aerius TaxID=200253 RepID=A0A2I9CR10_9DEIO|nr:hypothetical protein DAERI_010056 [Deinococcus aerius]